MITAAMVKELRERTGCGMMDCKNALVEAGGDLEKAIEVLRSKGLAKAAKKAGRVASEGLVEAYIHLGGRIGVLVEVNCETDFVAKTNEFKQLCRDIAMQIAAARPEFVTRDEVSPEIIEREKRILRQQALNEGKPEKVIEKMVEGRMEKYFKENCLLEQVFIKDQDKTIQEVVNEYIVRLGENITVRRFARFEVGEGIEKKSVE
ncbi:MULTISPECIES: translation elongation factor Ts [Syntrophothermus]|uniref:Elongation factor Ts n=1 Tax=Syntrophothermus lipocalidus (strain DSM 12680 / TGB-C1) TaxID=643648 RepID=D7CM31_SYNLT|nr:MULTISPECIES: translation elongation factor Ts [Syntrophothermus]ADI01766.1 translation elongation factor Ts [Syntrophothermus lipocalidus DSM 12680]HOV43478.1 translation elongation factor Ts [Syntrophothermus lipocalidus]